MSDWPTSAELVNLAVERLAGGSPSALADMLRLGANGYQKVYRWQRGATLGYDDAMKLLNLFGWLNLSADGAAVGAAVLNDERFRATVLRLLGELGDGMSSLQEGLQGLAEDRTAREKPGTQRRRASQR